jgi:imidazoleglycerol-phosphate dehydratase
LGGLINDAKCVKLGAKTLLDGEVMKKPRTAIIKRESQETKVSLELNLDGSGQWQISTGIKMFDHLLSQMAQHSRFDIKITASGDDQHHVAEDVAICLGKALGEALGEKRSITRMGDAAVPMDDAMATASVDISGRGYTVLDLPFADNDMLGFATDLIRHFLESLAVEARLNLHARILYGTNDHHKAEALFKALGRALDIATRVDERLAGELPTTKGLLED